MADAPLKRKLIVLEEGTLTSMALNAVLVKEFPILAPIAKIAKQAPRVGCGSCGTAAATRAKTFQGVKLAIAGMDGTKKSRLKALMNVQSMRLLYRDNSGKSHSLTF